MKPTGNTSIFRANPRGLFSCTILDSRHAFFRNHPHALREFHHPPADAHRTNHQRELGLHERVEPARFAIREALVAP